MSSSKAKTLAGLGLALAGTLALQACASDPHPEATRRAAQLLPTEQYGVTVTNAPEQVALGLHAGGLTATQQAALAQFVSRWRSNGGGAITLQAPVGGDPAVARLMEDAAAGYLVKLGAPRERLVVTGYAAGGDPKAPLLIRYERFEAQGPNCSGGWKNLTSTDSNTPYDHFGCAVTSNIAVQVANPRDFLAPAVETPADNTRRSVVLGKYRAGQVTSSASDTQANGKVSDSGGGSN